jgi:hypothetical protein
MEWIYVWLFEALVVVIPAVQICVELKTKDLHVCMHTNIATAHTQSQIRKSS